ncbi:N-terminal fungal transcription regulatory domain-containing protein [Purpureocillium lavendulum]|uniref:N-terminal fungal transcription regulatory domain-containing protein n=1 Tax=Purpureocillium lavendulum TaxID=1247861 RepID=A0AB34FW96_9HYPO|nr:N-terminal fungal transcription regulatory domain-containing protein [Purpureocillium lavendulum]
MFNAEPATHSHGIDPPSLCDERLQNLDIRLWTTVNIDSTTAARCISLYLETDHPLLGHFDPELFLSHLTTGQTEYCSALLVNALLYWASQMYSAVEPQTDDLAMRFCAEAERLWKEECVNDSVVNIAAAQFLSLGYLGHGRDHSVLHYLGQASNMGRRMGLFDSGPAANNPCLTFDGLTVAESRARLYAAWGFISRLMSLFYHQPGLNCPKSPPSLPIPGGEHLDDQQESEFAQAQAVPLLPFMGKTFAFLCQFWRIVREISLVYHQDGTSPVDGHHSLRFAEFKFRELLAWSNGLPSHLLRGDHKPHHVQILHLWFHAAVLELFRPCAQGGLAARRRLRTFTSTSSTPEAVCNASVEQLKHLILNFRLNYKSSTYTILWHTAMIYVANALLHSSKMDGWFSYFLLCVYGYERLRRSWRVTEAIAKGLLAMTLRSGDISNQTARHILQDLERKKVSEMPEPVSAQFPIDLDLALSDPISATAESLAGQFEETILLDDYTHEFDNDNDNDNGESSST